MENRFTAIDFELINEEDRCFRKISLARVDDGVVTKQLSFTAELPAYVVDSGFTFIHGIAPSEPNVIGRALDDVWPQILQFFNDEPIEWHGGFTSDLNFIAPSHAFYHRALWNKPASITILDI